MKKKYECVEAKGDLFQRYINDTNNYSPYSTEALYKNRHLYFAPRRVAFGQEEKEKDFVIFWRDPFTQGRLTFKYLPSEIFDEHDGAMKWEDENSFKYK